MLVQPLGFGQLVVFVDPVGDARKAAVLPDHHRLPAAQQLLRVEDVVDLRVLEQSVRVDAGAGHVEVAAHEGGHHRNVVANLLVEVVGDLSDHGGVHAVEGATQRGVLHHHGLQRDVARALADAQQRAVHRGSAVEPGRRGVRHRLVEVVVAVPLQHLAGHVGVLLQAVDDARHAPGQCHLAVRHAVAHGVAGPDLDGNPRVHAHLLKLIDKGHHEAVEIRAGDVLQVAAGHHARLEGVRHGGEVVIHGLLAGHLHLFEDVVVAAGHQDARLLDAQVPHQLEVLPAGPNPGGDLREPQPQLLALADRLAVLLAVHEELRLADDAVGSAEPGEQLVELHDLLHAVRLHRLLTVAEGGVRDPDVLRHAHRHPAMVEGNARHRVVGIDIAVQVRIGNVLEGIFIALLLQQVGFIGDFQHLASPHNGIYVSLYTCMHLLSSPNVRLF